MNEIMIDGSIVKTGATPAIVTFCGFKGPAEVRSVAGRCSRGEPFMRMDDVADWFRANVPQR